MYVDPEGNFPWLILGLLLLTPVGGIAAQIATSVVCYTGMAIASIWDEKIRDDMNDINWNPFNSNEEIVFKSNKVSFYKGAPVFLKNSGRSGSFYAISLNKTRTTDTLRHERGHNTQAMMMGIGTYGAMIGLPSWLEWGPKSRNYYNRPWEITADMFGGVSRPTHTQTDINRGWAYLVASSTLGPCGYFFC